MIKCQSHEYRLEQMRSVLREHGPLTSPQLAYRMGYSYRSSFNWLIGNYGLPKGVKRRLDSTFPRGTGRWVYYLED